MKKVFAFVGRFLPRQNNSAKPDLQLQEAEVFADGLIKEAMRGLPSADDLRSEAENVANQLGRKKHRRARTLRWGSFLLATLAFAYAAAHFGEIPTLESPTSLQQQDTMRLKGTPNFAYVWPTPGYFRITSPFGQRTRHGKKEWHYAIDIAAPRKSSVVAVADGAVTAVGKNSRSGNFIRIDHGDGWVTSYSHLSETLVKSGTQVTARRKIGSIGKTGNADGYHLHFVVQNKGRAINPTQILPKTSRPRS